MDSLKDSYVPYNVTQKIEKMKEKSMPYILREYRDYNQFHNEYRAFKGKAMQLS